MIDVPFIKRGDGPPVLLSHGTLMDATMFDPQLAALEDSYTVIAQNLRSRSARGLTPYKLADVVADTIALLDSLEIERCVIGGMSMGAFATLELALAHPERVAALVFIDGRAREYGAAEQAQFGAAFAPLDADGPLPLHFAEWCVPLCFGATTIKRNPSLIAAWLDRWTDLPARAVHFEAGSWLDMADRREVLREVDVPALVIHGAEDAVIAPDLGRELADGLPQGRFVLIDEAGHTASLEQPGAVNAALRAFLDEVHAPRPHAA